MKIGVAGPVDMAPLMQFFKGETVPSIYSFPLISAMILALKERGHEVTVFCGSEEIHETQWISGEGLTLCIAPRRKRRMAFDFYRLERHFLTAAMNQSDCDLIHAHWTYEFGAAAVACNKPYLVTAHDASLNILLFMLKPKIWRHWFFRVLLGIKTAHHAEHLSAVSPYVAQHIDRWFYPKNRVAVTPNGIHEDVLSGMDGAGCKTRNPIICSVLTGWGKMKNPKPALKAFAKIRQQYPSVIYKMYGGGYEKEGPAHQWARMRGLDQGVEFCGRVSYEQLLQEVRRSTVFLHPALEESFGMSICEAMALGVPVVGGAESGGVSYVLHEGAAGVLVNVKSPSSISDGVLGLLHDDKKRRQVAECGRDFARENFTVTKMMDRYEAAYAAILQNRWDSLDLWGR